MLKLYVWENVLCDWSCGSITVLAESEAQARELVRSKLQGDYHIDELALINDPDVHPQEISVPTALFHYGSA